VIAESENRIGRLTLMSRSPWGEGTSVMSQISRGIFGFTAIALTLGAVPLAMGRDLAGSAAAQDRLQNAFETTAATINRSAKSDRPAVLVRSSVETRTIVLAPTRVPGTSVLVRVPIETARAGSPAPLLMKSGSERPVACEPSVSVLTEVAKHLQAGRCVT
jgi:hypothetical protein